MAPLERREQRRPAGELSFPEPPVLGERWLRRVERGFLWLERVVDKAVPPALNPVAQTGAVAVVTFLIACVSGVLVLVWYSSSVTHAYESVVAMEQAPFTSGLVRSVHRYSSDACMLFVLLHSARLFFARRFGGTRKLAWATGIILLVALWGTGWLGYWLVWDARAQGVAMGSAKLMDVLPLFSDPPSRSFLTDAGLNSLLFFVVFFLHMLLPLGMSIPLWLHITRLSRARFLTRLPLGLWIVGSLVLLSLVLPAQTAQAAKMTSLYGAMSLDAWYLLPLWLTDRLGAGALWAVFLGLTTVLVSIPWWMQRKQALPAVVNTSACNACTLCEKDCPYDAIRMVPRTDGRRFELQAEVDPSKCVGCGICAGSCDPGAIGLEPLAVRATRRNVEGWIDEELSRGGPSHLLFACNASAGGGLEVDKEGRCPSLPGYRVLQVPCAGWVHALSVERALKRGAKGVMIAACGPGECNYREGPEFTLARMKGERAPALRLDQVDGSLVRVVQSDAGGKGRLVRQAASFFRSKQPPGGGRRLPAAVGGALVMGATLLLVWGPSRASYPGQPGQSELVVSFKHAGLAAEACRQVSAEEKATLPPHMRRDEVCERRRADVRLRVEVDGEVVLERAYPPGGLSGDGASVAVERLLLTPGPHRVSVAVGESGQAQEWTHRDAREVLASSRERVVVVFDRLGGFLWEGG